jgi:hypothetical protein
LEWTVLPDALLLHLIPLIVMAPELDPLTNIFLMTLFERVSIPLVLVVVIPFSVKPVEPDEFE